MYLRLLRFALLIVIAGLVICNSLTVRAKPTTDLPFPTATPESQGLSSDSLNKIVSAVRDMEKRNMFVGAELVIIKNRHLVLHETFGLSDRENKTGWLPNTICNIRSMSKPFTGAAIQLLIDRGRLKLDDPASRYLPSFDNESLRGITIRHLLSHMSGLPLTAITTSINQFKDLQSQVASLGQTKLRFEPGSDFWYSDAGSDVLGAIIEKVTGMTLDRFITDNLIKPLGMTDTFYGIYDEEPLWQRTASVYMGSPNAWTRLWSPDQGALYPFAWGSQTIYSTPLDYARFLYMWIDNGRTLNGTQLLSAQAVKRTLTPVTPAKMLGSDAPYPTDFTGLQVYYGQMSMLRVPVIDKGNDAAEVKPVIIGHGGSDGTVAWAWPERDLMILFFTQSRGGTSVLRIEEPIDQNILHPDRFVKKKDVPVEYQPYLGTYIANYATFKNEPVEVIYRKGKLALDIPSQLIFELNEPDEQGHRAFSLAPNQVFVTFEQDEYGNVNLLKLHQGGMVFKVPRKGTRLALEQAKRPIVDPEAIQPFVGQYKDSKTGATLSIFLDDKTLCVKPNTIEVVFHLIPSDESGTFRVKQVPQALIRFNADEDGHIISLTRIIGDNLTEYEKQKVMKE